MTNQPNHTDLREAILHDARAMYTTDENSPVIVQIPIDDLMKLIEAYVSAPPVNDHQGASDSHNETVPTKGQQVDARSVLQDLLDWQEQWASMHTEPFNWHGAVKAMQVMKEPRKPFTVLSDMVATHSDDTTEPIESAPRPSNDQTLDDLLDNLFFEHDDNDNNTCASKYQVCQDCGREVYWSLFNTKERHIHDSWVAKPCDCGTAKEREETKAQLIKWRDTAVVEELKALLKREYSDGNTLVIPYGGKPGRFEEKLIVSSHFIRDRIKDLSHD